MGQQREDLQALVKRAREGGRTTWGQEKKRRFASRRQEVEGRVGTGRGRKKNNIFTCRQNSRGRARGRARDRDKGARKGKDLQAWLKKDGVG